MENVLERPKSAKEILKEREEQKKKSLEMLAQEEREKEERRKKLRRRLETAFIAYVKMAKEHEAAAQRSLMQEELRKEFLKEHLRYSYQNNQAMLQQLKAHEQTVSDFFTKDESPHETEQREALLKESNISSAEFASLALSSCAKEKDYARDAEAVFQGKQPSENLLKKRTQGKVAAMHALHDLNAGSVEKMEDLLKNGLAVACLEFSNAKQPFNAMSWSCHVNSILSIISTHPVLFKNGADQKLVEMATGVASMGKIMESGYKALEEIQKCKSEGPPMSPEQEEMLNAKVLLMQQVDLKRSVDQYKSFFAKDYHPKNGLPPEKLETLLLSLQKSKTMKELSRLDPDERLFYLSDEKSRIHLADNLFKENVIHIPTAEKKLSPETSNAQRNTSSPMVESPFLQL